VSRRSTAPIWGGALVVVAMLVAAVFLARAGWKTEGIVGLLVAVGASAGTAQLALSKVATVDERAQDVQTRTATIERQTNGEMTATIHGAVHHAVAEELATLHAAIPPPLDEPQAAVVVQS
jgi:hypothetical protein